MPDETLTQQDAEHLRLLSIFHYVMAGLLALFACFPIFHLVLGSLIVLGPGLSGHGPESIPVVLIGGFFMVFAAVVMLGGWLFSACVVLAGRALVQRRRYVFCLVVAGIEAALCVPFGTALGICTIVVLLRPTVKQAFGA